jgi:hypothetical protein
MIHPKDVAELEESIRLYTINFPPPYALSINLRLASAFLAEARRLEREVERHVKRNVDESTLTMDATRGYYQSYKAQEIKKIMDRVSKTTPPTGETTWWFEEDGTGYLVATGSDPEWRSKTTGRSSEDFGHFSRRADADFVSHAREDVFWLLSELRTLKASLTPQEHPDTDLLVEALARLHTWDRLGGDPSGPASKRPATYYDLIRQQRWVENVAHEPTNWDATEDDDDLEKRFKELNERIHPRARHLLAKVEDENRAYIERLTEQD